jgi:UDP-N-acetyl-D-glucosamine dehydrogenase
MNLMLRRLDSFEDLIASRNCTVGVVGLGYVGIPLARRIVEVGLPVIGFDVAPQRVAELNAGMSPLHHVADQDIAAMVKAGFRATGDFARAIECDAIVICVPTPVDASRVPDLGYVRDAVRALLPWLRPGQLIALESTTWPGTTEEVLRPMIESTQLTVGRDIYLVYSPEREDPGNRAFSTRSIPKVLGGSTAACLSAGTAFYRTFIDRVVPVSSTRAAEMVKLLENTHRAVNIGLVNELKVVSDRMGLDIFEIVDAAATKPFGFRAYYPGPGIGGHCIPVDPFYLSWKARQYGVNTRFIELAGEVNAAMPTFVVDKTAHALNRCGRALNGARILVLGIAYKPDVDDVRESPALDVISELRDRGAEISYSDPLVPVADAPAGCRPVEVSVRSLEAADAVLLLTDHSAFDYAMIRSHAPIIIDARGRFQGDGERIWRA